jgi:hypothetical protein
LCFAGAKQNDAGFSRALNLRPIGFLCAPLARGLPLHLPDKFEIALAEEPMPGAD